jgi:hypothetical protein
MTTQVTTPADIGGLVPAEPADIEVASNPESPEPPKPIELEPATPSRSRSTTTRRARPARSPKPSPELAKKLPTSERIYVYFREKNGKSTFVEDYSTRDLTGHGSIEAFLKHYAVPNYGFGDYEVYMKNSKGELEPTASASLKAPIDSSSNGTSLSDHVKELLNAQAALGQAAPKEPSAMEQLQVMMTLAEKMNGDKGGGMDPMTMMLMTKMMDDKPAAPAGPDPIMIALVQKLEDMEKQQERRAMMSAAAPLPPPPAAPDPMASMAPVLTMMMKSMETQAAQTQAMLAAQSQQTQAMMTALMQPKPERNVMGELQGIATLLKPSDDGLKTKDILGMLPTMKELLNPKPEKDSLNTALEQMRMIRMLKEEMGMEESPAQQGASFWDFMQTFVQSDLGDQVSAAIASGKQAEATEQAISGGQQQGEQQSEQQAGPMQVPKAFAPHAKALNEATDAQSRVKAAVSGIQVLLGNKQFRPHVAKILVNARENKKTESMQAMANILGALVDAEFLTEEAVTAVINDFDENWVLIMQGIGFKHITEDPDPPTPQADEEPSAEASPEPAPAPAPPEHSPEPKLSAAEVEVEDEEDAVELPEGYESGATDPDVIDVSGAEVKEVVHV